MVYEKRGKWYFKHTCKNGIYTGGPYETEFAAALILAAHRMKCD